MRYAIAILLLYLVGCATTGQDADTMRTTPVQDAGKTRASDTVDFGTLYDTHYRGLGWCDDSPPCTKGLDIWEPYYEEEKP